MEFLLLAFFLMFVAIFAFCKSLMYLYEWAGSGLNNRRGEVVKTSKTIGQYYTAMRRGMRKNRIKRLRRLKLEYEVSILELDNRLEQEKLKTQIKEYPHGR